MADDTQVTISERLWSEVVEQHDPQRWKIRDPSYEFSNGRKFEDPKDE